MKVISVINPKGGVGKTPIACHITQHLSNEGYTVGVMEGDPQRGISLFYDVRKANYPELPSPRVWELPTNQSPTELAEEIADEGIDVLVIDTQLGYTSVHKEIVTFSDVIITPVAPGELGYAAMRPAIDSMMKMVRDGQSSAFIGLVKTKFTKNQKASANLKRMVEEDDYPFFDSALPQSVKIGEAMDEGLTLFDAIEKLSKSRKVAYENPVFYMKRFCKDVESLLSEEQ